MDILAPYAIIINTYENQDNIAVTHIFWGKTLKEAFGNANAHLKTDHFFSSSFEGEMEWNNTTLNLYNESLLIKSYNITSNDELDNIYNELYNNAIENNDKNMI